MTKPDFWDLLARWEEGYGQGEEIPLEELCREAPELLPRLRHHVDALKRTSWLLKPLDEGESESADVLPPPTILGEYTILERIASGGMGVVYKALHRRMDRLVAVKLLGAVETPESLERFQREVRAVAKLSHPNIVTAHDAGEIGGCPYLVMELIEGCDLARHVEVHGPMPVTQAVAVIVQVARGLECAHSKGIIHGDVKPSNLILAADGVVKVLDLGLARLQAGSADERLAGTVDYLAPEATHEGAILDHRADIYGLGCTLWFLLTGKPLFECRSVMEKLVAHREAVPPSLATVRADVPPALEAVFRRTVAKRPEDRFSSAQELADALTATLARRSKRGYLVTLAVGLALILCGVLFAATYWPGTSRTPDQATTKAEDEGLPTVTALRSFKGHTGPVLSVAFSPEGRTIATGSADATVRLWSVDGGKGIVLPQVTGCTALAFTDGGKTLGCGCDNGTVRLWDLHGTEPKEGLVMPGHAGAITCVAFTPDGKLLATGGTDGTVRLLDRSAAKPQGATIPKAGGVVLSLGFSAGGDKLLVGYGDEGDKPAEFWVWQLRQPEGKLQLALHQRAPLVGLRDVRSMLISPEGNRILAATGGEVFVWARVEGKDSFRVMGSFQGPARGIALSPDGRLALTCGEGGFRSWDVRSMKVLARFVGHEGAVNCVAFSPDGETVVSGGADGTVRIWRTRNRVANVIFKADGRDQAGGDAGHERRVAEWVLGLGGNLTAVTTEAGSVIGIERPADLTSSSFHIVEVNLRSIKPKPDLAELSGLAELRRLRLADVTWGDAALARLVSLEKLECLELGRAGITDEGMRHLRGMSGLRSLSIDTAAVTNDGVRCLAGLRRLEILRLNRLKITDEALAHLSGLHSLQALELYETPTTGAGCKHLAKLPNLNYLMLIGTQVADTDMDDLALLQGLTTLRVERTRLTEPGVQRLRQKLPKCTVTR